MTTAKSKAYKGLGMEGPIARWYERNTRKGMEDFRRDARRLGALLPAGGDVLEVAPGPGFLAVELARLGRLRVSGLDISRTFVELARGNAQAAQVPVDFCVGNAAAMPYADNSFDLLVCRAAFKNFALPVQALREMHRVLRPNGTGVVIDLRRDVPMADIQRHIASWGLAAWNRWLTLATFRFLLLKRAYTKEELERMLAGIPFGRVEVRTEDIGMEAWFKK